MRLTCLYFISHNLSTRQFPGSGEGRISRHSSLAEAVPTEDQVLTLNAIAQQQQQQQQQQQPDSNTKMDDDDYSMVHPAAGKSNAPVVNRPFRKWIAFYIDTFQFNFSVSISI